jgi:hypothetical protein
VRFTTLLFATGFAAGCCAGAVAQVDPTALVRKSIENYERNWRESKNWRYRQADVSKGDGTDGADVSEVFPLEGTPYERLVLRDGRALTAEEERKEEHKYQKALRQRQSETPEQRKERIRKYETERNFVKDIPNAYNFELAGEETVDGRPAWVIKMTPKPGFIPTMPHAAMLQHIEGTLWMDKEDLQWAKAEAHVKDTIEFGWVLARIGPGAKITVEQTRVADGVWMPRQITINGTARVLLVHNKVLDEKLTYSGFHKDEAAALAAADSDPARSRSLRGTDSFR